MKGEHSAPPCSVKMVLCPEVIITHEALTLPPVSQSTEKKPAAIPVSNNKEPEHPFTNPHDASVMDMLIYSPFSHLFKLALGS
jgi:hypothetical protein